MTTLDQRPAPTVTAPTGLFTVVMVALTGLLAEPSRERISSDEEGLILAHAAAFRADCTRRRVGAVVADVHGRIVGAGRNGAPPGAPGCLTEGACPRGQMSKTEVPPGSSYATNGVGACIANHAETNACLFSDPLARRGGTIYITDAPCDDCSRLLAGSGLARYVWPRATGNPEAPFEVVSQPITGVAFGGHY